MSTAFVVVFALFVLAMVGLAVTAVRWGVRRDRAAKMGPAEMGPAEMGPAQAGGSADSAGGPGEP
jgi:hypothetical protein